VVSRSSEVSRATMSSGELAMGKCQQLCVTRTVARQKWETGNGKWGMGDGEWENERGIGMDAVSLRNITCIHNPSRVCDE
jgi:hypothetical protein